MLGAPFQIVEFVAGQVVRRRAQLEAFNHTVIDGCVDSLIRVLVDLHSVDPNAVGLGDFGKPSGYLERQVRRWGSQWDLVRLPDDHRDADVQRLHSGLRQSIPQQSRTSIVHGDYRIDNTILDNDDPTGVRAVVDWELSTLGDPLSDAALMCVYRDPALDLIVNAQAAWTSPLLPTADELADRYSWFPGCRWRIGSSTWRWPTSSSRSSPPASISGGVRRSRLGERDTQTSCSKSSRRLISRGLAKLAKLPG